VFDTLLPPDISVCTAAPWMFRTPAHPEEEALLTRAVPSRQAEFRAGRHAYRSAVKRLGVAGGALLSGRQREPLWPEGILGSITHTGSYCVVALGRSSHWRGIAIDAEDDTPLTADLLPLVCRPEEREKLAAYRTAGLVSPCKVIFSAKECIHKIYFPLNRHTLEFTDARIELDPQQGRFSADIVNAPSGVDVPVVRLYGRFALDGQRIHTTILASRIMEGIAEC
jgi:4'-phosphopantetheinyl transferase EntD